MVHPSRGTLENASVVGGARHLYVGRGIGAYHMLYPTQESRGRHAWVKSNITVLVPGGITSATLLGMRHHLHTWLTICYGACMELYLPHITHNIGVIYNVYNIGKHSIFDRPDEVMLKT